MSRTETHIGKLKPFVRAVGESTDEYIQRYAKSVNRMIGFDTTPDAYDFSKLFCGEAVMVNETIYTVITKIELDDDICYANQHSDGTIDFVLRFHNGGTYFEEMIEEAVSQALTVKSPK